MRKINTWLVPLLLLLATFLVGRDALPCSPSFCEPAKVFPMEGSTVPANLPAVVVFPWEFGDLPSGFRWVDSTETAVEFTEERSQGYILLKPTTPLTTGETYTVSFKQGCPNLYPSSASTTFSTGPEADIPSEPPTLALESVAMSSVSTADGRGDCTEFIPAAVARLAISIPGEDAHPFLATAVVQTFVDGEFWARSQPGDALSNHQWRGMPFGEWKPPRVVFAGCPPLDGVYPGLEQGAHQVTASLVVPGQDPDVLASEPLQVILYCSNIHTIGPTDEVTVSFVPPLPLALPSSHFEGRPVNFPPPPTGPAQTDATSLDVDDTIADASDSRASATCAASPWTSPSAIVLFLMTLVLFALTHRAPNRPPQ